MTQEKKVTETNIDHEVLKKHKDLIECSVENLNNAQKLTLYTKLEDAIQEIRYSQYYRYSQSDYEDYKQVIFNLMIKRDLCELNKFEYILEKIKVKIKKYVYKM